MSLEYDVYLRKHTSAVRHASQWLIDELSDLLNSVLPDLRLVDDLISNHDRSKFEVEYKPYDRYFYGDSKDPEVRKNFNYAWLHHIHNNPHHWQYWVLIEDDRETGESFKALDMPDNYIFEMICDWWSFSWIEHFKQVKENPMTEYSSTVGLDGIFDWYEAHKNTIILSNATRNKVETILDALKDRIS